MLVLSQLTTPSCCGSQDVFLFYVVPRLCSFLFYLREILWSLALVCHCLFQQNPFKGQPLCRKCRVFTFLLIGHSLVHVWQAPSHWDALNGLHKHFNCLLIFATIKSVTMNIAVKVFFYYYLRDCFHILGQIIWSEIAGWHTECIFSSLIRAWISWHGHQQWMKCFFSPHKIIHVILLRETLLTGLSSLWL